MVKASISDPFGGGVYEEGSVAAMAVVGGLRVWFWERAKGEVNGRHRFVALCEQGGRGFKEGFALFTFQCTFLNFFFLLLI